MTEEVKNRRPRYAPEESVPERRLTPLGDVTTELLKLRKLIQFEMHSTTVFLEKHGCVLQYGGMDCRFRIEDRFYK